jgi:hypothetical protein
MAVYYPQCHAAISVVLDGFVPVETDVFGNTVTRPLSPLEVSTRPKSCTVHLNSYKEPDTFDIEFDAKALPFVPEQIRSCAVAIWMFDATDLVSPIEPFLVDSNRVIYGIADDVSFEPSDAGTIIRLSGRDFTCLLSDRKWDPTKRIPLGVDLQSWVQGMVNAAAAPVAMTNNSGNMLFAGLEVLFEADGVPPPIAGSNFYKTKKRGQHVKDGKSYWDIIYLTCLSHGFIVYVRDDKVIITNPQSFTKERLDQVRQVAFGRNLSNLRVERHIGKERVPQIVATCWDPSQRKNISVTYPATKDNPTTGVGTKKDEFEYVTPGGGVRDYETLRKYAIAYYNHRAKSEATLQFSTKDLRDLAGLRMLTMRSGDGVSLGFDPYNNDSAVLRTLSPGQRYNYLVRAGFDADVANVVANHYEKLVAFKEPYYVKGVTLTFDTESGIGIDVEAMSYISKARDGHEA